MKAFNFHSCSGSFQIAYYAYVSYLQQFLGFQNLLIVKERCTIKHTISSS